MAAITENILYREELPPKQALFKLFLTTGWNENYCLDAERLFDAVKNSWYYIYAYSGTQLVGSGRIICDGSVHALILDLIVDPEYRRRGIAGNILNRLIEKCRDHKIRDIQLFAARDTRLFYEKFGFQKRPSDAPGMEINVKYLCKLTTGINEEKT